MKYKLFVLPILLFSGCLLMAEPDMLTTASSNFRMNTKADNAIMGHILVRNCKSLVFDTLVGNYRKPFISDHYPEKTVSEIH
ncbi:MAG: hypothetical protein IJR53_05290 [Bacteroidales bacterium]|nr:hypothetical protein [Bacteroidales bacterium]